jgi:choice-of-anchor A domain-containing protein
VRKAGFMKNFNILLTTSIGILSLYMMPIYAANPTAYDFNVYTIGNIGTQSNPYASDIEGISGSGGNTYFSGYSINGSGTAYSYSAYTGGTFTGTSGSVNGGGIDAGGTVNLTSSTVYGNVNSGGSLQGSNGTINGNVTLTGTNTSSLTINGTVTANHTYTPSLSLSSITKYFQNASAYWAALPSNATFNIVSGQIQVSNLAAGRNVVDITLAQLSSATSIKLNGSASSYVIFNITDTTPTNQTIKDVTYSLSGGITQSDIIYNLPNATQLTLNGGDYLNILATNADVTFTSGALTGTLVAKDLYGSGQIDTGSFAGYQADQNNFNVQAPEPSTYITLASFIGLIMLIKGRKKNLASIN